MRRDLLLLAFCFALFVTSFPPFPVAGFPSQSANPSVILPVGTRIQLVLNSTLSTQGSRNGDSFYALVDYPIFVQGRLVIPADSWVRGMVLDSRRAGRVKGRSEMILGFDSLTLINGVQREILAEIFGMNDANETAQVQGGRRLEGPTSRGEDVGIVVQGGLYGTTIGGISYGGEGAAIGSAIGALAGLTMVLSTRGRDVFLGRGTAFEIVLQKNLEFAPDELDFSAAPTLPDRRSVREQPPPRRDSGWRRCCLGGPFYYPW